MPHRAGAHRKYTSGGLTPAGEPRATPCAGCTGALPIAGRRVAFEEDLVMLDIVYLLAGAAFLGVCVLYTCACDHL
jgi:hypothetical protein